MKIENCKLKISNSAFTLIEIMVAIAIVGILSAVVLTSMQSYGKKARASKALASLSSAIPSMISCWGNGSATDVNSPSSNGDICKLSSGYGKWPTVGSGDLSSYVYGGNVSSKTSWYVMLTSGSDNYRICCNSTMNSCKILDTASTACNASSPSY